MIRVVEDDLRGPEIASLLREHLGGMFANSPPESVHALDLDQLRRPEITFWSAWVEDGLAGCGALKALGLRQGEVKSMRTRQAYLRMGVGTRLLETIIRTGRARGYERLSLETGSGPAFDAAHSFYRRHGFEECAPFGSYCEDPFSRFFTLRLDG